MVSVFFVVLVLACGAALCRGLRLPLNVAPLQTTRVNLRATIELPPVPEGDACRNTNETFALYRKLAFPEQLELRVELIGLGERHFTTLLHYQPREKAETPAAPLRLVA